MLALLLVISISGIPKYLRQQLKFYYLPHRVSNNNIHVIIAYTYHSVHDAIISVQ